MPKAARMKEKAETRAKKSGHYSGLYEAATDWVVHAHAALRRGLLDVVDLNLNVSHVTWCVKRPAIAHWASRCPDVGPLAASIPKLIETSTNRCTELQIRLLSGHTKSTTVEDGVAVG